MGAFSGLSFLLKEDLAIISKNMSYSKENILILQGDIETLSENYPDTYNNLLSCTHHRDNRTPMEYAQDIVASWLFEDYLISEFEKYGYSLKLSGADKKREILPNIRVSSDSDCIFIYEGKRLSVEIMSDYTGYWAKKKKMDLRDSKYKKLFNSKGVLLGISVKDNTFTIIDFTKGKTSAIYLKYHPAYHKPAYQIDLKVENFKPFSIQNITNSLSSLL